MDQHDPSKEDIKGEESNDADNNEQYGEDEDDSPVGGKGKPPQKRAGRRKINIEFIKDKSRRHITFSKRKAGIMKKAYELSTLTGTQVLLLVASETGHVYTFATPKLQPLITKTEGKNLIQACLNAPDPQQLGDAQEMGPGMDNGAGQMPQGMGGGQGYPSMDDLEQSKKMRGDMKALPVNQGYGQPQMPPASSPGGYGQLASHHQQSLPSLPSQGGHQGYPSGLDLGGAPGYMGGQQQDYNQRVYGGSMSGMGSPTLPSHMGNQYGGGGYGPLSGQGGIQDGTHKVTINNSSYQYPHQQ